jgi:hypothetical protein
MFAGPFSTANVCASTSRLNSEKSGDEPLALRFAEPFDSPQPHRAIQNKTQTVISLHHQFFINTGKYEN